MLLCLAEFVVDESLQVLVDTHDSAMLALFLDGIHDEKDDDDNCRDDTDDKQ